MGSSAVAAGSAARGPRRGGSDRFGLIGSRGRLHRGWMDQRATLHPPLSGGSWPSLCLALVVAFAAWGGRRCYLASQFL